MKKFAIRDHIRFDSKTFHRSLIFSNESIKALVLNFRPGQTLPSHNHPGYCLQLMVIEGEGVLTVDEKEVPVQKGDLFFIDGDEFISFQNVGTKNASLYVILSKKQ